MKIAAIFELFQTDLFSYAQTVLIASKSHIVEVSGFDLISGNLPYVSQSGIVRLSTWVIAIFIHKLTVLSEPYM
jgi:hypothetical protein